MIISCIKTVVEAIAGFNECVTFSQWFRSLGSGSEGTEKQELKEDDVLKLQSSFQCLQDTLPAMYAFINRVEWRSHEKGVPELLPKLKAAVYDAEDLLEDFRCYEQKVKIEGTMTSLESGSKFFQDFNTKLTAIKNRLDNQAMTLKIMGLHKATLRFDTSVRPVTTRYPTEAKIFGRDDEIKELIRWLGVPANNRRCPSRPKRKRRAIRPSSSNQVCATLDNNEAIPTIPSLPVLPIVGIGGVGKTTLAQNICKHPQVKSHFDMIVWICVSDDFDVKRLTKEAIEQFSGKAPTKDNLDSLFAELANSLKLKRFLIVLDDMWAEEAELWKTFYTRFEHVVQGSMMLVTTRSQKVADIVYTMDPFPLEGLKDNVFQEFFELCVFGSDSSKNNPELKQIAEQILPKLKGSPLAAKPIGRLLGTSLDPTDWNMILNSPLWQLTQEKTDIFPALRLSYIYLPFHLKRCFSFCAVYPKDYNFVKEDLAEIWMAEGFVESQYNIPLQQTACKYFEELAHLSFFQKLRGKYVMHDLIHDMAQLVLKDECFIIKEKKDLERIPQNVRHLVTRDLLITNIGEISKDQVAEIELTKKEYIFGLKLIWYKRTSQLPECDDIELFKALQPPTNIKSVCLEGYPGEHLPRWFHGSDEPTIFSSLTEIRVTNCPRLSSLEQFLQPAYMPAIKKMHIIDCTSLEYVPVERFGGFPSLEELEVYKCPKINSQHLQASSIKKLVLQDSGNLGNNIDCSSLTSFVLSKYHLASVTINRENFTPLTELTIEDCRELETLNGGRPILTSLSISVCPHLKWENGMVLPLSLQKLHLWDCGNFSLGYLENLASLQSLQMDACKHIESIPRDLWSSLKSLQRLCIMNCENLESIGALEGIAHIPKVHISSCPKLKGVQQLLWRGYSGGGYGVINYHRIRVLGVSGVAPITYV